jgi:hypothetical protein
MVIGGLLAALLWFAGYMLLSEGIGLSLQIEKNTRQAANSAHELLPMIAAVERQLVGAATPKRRFVDVGSDEE